LTKPDETLEKWKFKFGRKLHKPLGHHDEQSYEKPTLELLAPDPETHGQGAKPVESDHAEPGKLCPACGSPTHARDTKCPWCGAALAQV
jgi:rubrerythrin